MYFPESHQWSEISPLSKVTLVLGKARSCRVPNLGCRGTESPGWFDILPKLSARALAGDAWAGALLWWSCQSPAAHSPVAHSCSLLNHLNSFCRGMFKLTEKLKACVLLYSLIHFECHDHIVHMLTQRHLPPHWLVKPSLFAHVHSSPLSLAARLHPCHTSYSCYISNGWTFSR